MPFLEDELATQLHVETELDLQEIVECVTVIFGLASCRVILSVS